MLLLPFLFAPSKSKLTHWLYIHFCSTPNSLPISCSYSSSYRLHTYKAFMGIMACWYLTAFSSDLQICIRLWFGFLLMSDNAKNKVSNHKLMSHCPQCHIYSHNTKHREKAQCYLSVSQWQSSQDSSETEGKKTGSLQGRVCVLTTKQSMTQRWLVRYSLKQSCCLQHSIGTCHTLHTSW